MFGIVNGVSKFKMSVVPFDSITLEALCGNCNEDNYVAPISFWPPTKAEIEMIVESIKYAKFAEQFEDETGKTAETWEEFINWHKAKSDLEKPLVYDFGCGNGFLSLLLAMTGEVEVIGFDPNRELIEEVRKVYKHPNLELISGEVLHVCNAIVNPGGRKNSRRKPDAIFCSYMPPCIDFTPEFWKVDPSCIVYVRNSVCGNHFDIFEKEFREDYRGRSLESATEADLDYYLSFRTGKNLRRAFEWKTITPDELHLRLYNECVCPEHRNRFDCFVDIQYRKDVPKAPYVNRLEHNRGNRYAWELAMTDKSQFPGHLFNSFFPVLTFNHR